MAKCRHNTLRFGSGGFYVMCADCWQTWVALKTGRVNDAELDYERGGDRLFGTDLRVNPEEPTNGEA